MSCTTSHGNSVENIHNLVHNAVGGYGHMSDTAASAFDPIFWLHHANIDRLFSMWQAINPESYVVPTVNIFGSYAEPRGFVDDEDSNLLPFHSDDGSGFWTSKGVRSTRTFGYTYRDVIDWNTTQGALASNVRANVNRLYNPTGTVVNGSHQRNLVSTGIAEVPEAHPDSFHVPSTSRGNASERQWTIAVQVQRFAHRSPFFIDFFVGPPPISPSAWPSASNLVGSHAQFIAMDSDTRASCVFANALSHGEVSLTHHLLVCAQGGALTNLEPASVIPFLIKSLNWRARDMEGRELELGSLVALSITVGSQIVRSAKVFNQFPTYSIMETYANITAGKTGGMARQQSPDEDCQ